MQSNCQQVSDIQNSAKANIRQTYQKSEAVPAVSCSLCLYLFVFLRSSEQMWTEHATTEEQKQNKSRTPLATAERLRECLGLAWHPCHMNSTGTLRTLWKTWNNRCICKSCCIMLYLWCISVWNPCHVSHLKSLGRYFAKTCRHFSWTMATCGISRAGLGPRQHCSQRDQNCRPFGSKTPYGFIMIYQECCGCCRSYQKTSKVTRKGT